MRLLGIGQLGLAVFVAATIALFGIYRYAPLKPLPSSVDTDTFSAERAEPILELLVGDGIPHPSGTDQNEIVRQRILDFFAELDIPVEQHATSNMRRRTGEIFPLVNLIARIPGSNSSATIALTSHYDSTFNGPGAADDGVGVAVSLEIARFFAANPPKNNLVFLITDGEELGLLGAEKFVLEHPLAKEIDVVINLEARGTKGPSLLFETGPRSYWTIQQFAKVARKPFTSSLFYEIYKTLPNDTDFTRFMETQMEGFNFAFIGDVKNYHTPDDNFETVDRGSMQHHGEHALELLKLLADSETLMISDGRAIYFDLLAFRVFYWRESWRIPLAIVPTALLAWFVIVNLRANRIGLRQGLFAASFTLGVVVFMAAIQFAVNLGLGRDGFLDSPWPFRPVPILLTFWLVGLLVSIGCGCVLFRGAAEATFASVWLGWLVLLWLTTLFVAGASYLFLVPCVIAGIAAVLPLSMNIKSQIAWVGATLIWLPMEPLFYDAVGFSLNLALIARVVVVMSALFPVIAVACTRMRPATPTNATETI
ncbi:MAG TPA: M28 family peptidase [Pirellulaceae bacterium]|nr:M28 family peptidase [Pirellulaceae bacterium]HMO92376.1 M28 family peptidase [Pirellulaceae bacterium]HMP70761.1 M28 family peptidase [Pirellulaceae bacterium]